MKLKSTSSTHVLLTLGVLFTIGGVMRFMPSPIADAADPVRGDDTVEIAEQQPINEQALLMTDVTNPDQVCFTGESAALLAADQKIVERDSKAIREEKLTLQAWEDELKTRTDELRALQSVLDQRWADMQAASDQDVSHLAQMYGAMKADQASEIFNQMDPAFAAGFLRLMPSESAGRIMANMETDKAYIVSVELANLNSDIRMASLTP